ncbi:MAG: discoidin domain-containing protein [Tannerella sp.]|jgi:hypothetical protein|nr:discoidin domain-containing protein [Tannerella sp.]
MNRILLFFSVSVFFLLFSACQDDDKAADSLEIVNNRTNMEFGKESGQSFIGVLSNVAWTAAVSGGDWLSCSPASGEGNGNVTVSAKENTGQSIRNGSVTITSENGAFTKTVTVSQVGTQPDIAVFSGTVNIPPAGGDTWATVTATGAWTVQIPATWVIQKPREVADDLVEFTAEANETGDTRTAAVTFSLTGTDRQASFTIAQESVSVEVETPPAEAQIGQNIVLNGTNLRLIKQVWFGSLQGEIDGEGRTDEAITVTIPATESAKPGEVDLKIIHSSLNREKIVGRINLLPAQPVITNYSKRVPLGGAIYMEGSNISGIQEVWIGAAKGVIMPGVTDALIKVSISAAVTAGTVPLKIIFGGSSEKEVGNIELYSPDPEKNLTLYAGSLLADVPAIAWSSQNAFNVGGGRMAMHAFDGAINNDTWASVDYAAVYGADRIPTQGRTYWQVNSAAVPAELPGEGPAPTGNTAPPWIALNYSATPEGSVTFDKIDLMPRENNGLVKKYTVEVSDDGNVWTKVIKTEDSQQFPSSFTIVTHNLPQPVTARYVRWVCVEGNATGNNTGLSHFALYYGQTP